MLTIDVLWYRNSFSQVHHCLHLSFCHIFIVDKEKVLMLQVTVRERRKLTFSMVSAWFARITSGWYMAGRTSNRIVLPFPVPWVVRSAKIWTLSFALVWSKKWSSKPSNMPSSNGPNPMRSVYSFYVILKKFAMEDKNQQKWVSSRNNSSMHMVNQHPAPVEVPVFFLSLTLKV